VTYTYKYQEFPSQGFPTTEQIGFIAQELEEVFPQVVTTDKETGMKAVAYGHTCAIAIAAVQELKTEHDQVIAKLTKKHEEEIEKLTKEMEELKVMMKQLLLMQSNK
jgi:signal transduction protein with GAF and PtsI domain